MSFVLEFLPEASEEGECITGDYEARVHGLGTRFRKQVESACAAIVQHPLLWRERPGGYRRVNLPGFPYYIAFVLREERAVVLAIAHANRHPGYWKARMR
jgi:plasmid stabilization system protein ParE